MLNRKKIVRKKKVSKVRNATLTTINGILFKSKLEAYCYQQLLEKKIPFKYEEDSFILVNAFSFRNNSWESGKSKGENVFKKANPTIRAMTYKPDFTNLQQKWIIECKGLITDSFPLRWKLFKKYIQDNNLNYDLYMPRNKKQVDEVIKLIRIKNESTNIGRK